MSEDLEEWGRQLREASEKYANEPLPPEATVAGAWEQRHEDYLLDYHERKRLAQERQKEIWEQAVAHSLTLPRLLEQLGWSEDYAKHFVQDYCTCYFEHGGIDVSECYAWQLDGSPE